MKKLLFAALFAGSLVFSSCGADQATVDAFANDMCATMEKYNPDDLNSMMEVAGEMMEIATKYSDVSDAQVKEAMEAKCPEGYKKMMEMGQ